MPGSREELSGYSQTVTTFKALISAPGMPSPSQGAGMMVWTSWGSEEEDMQKTRRGIKGEEVRSG